MWRSLGLSALLLAAVLGCNKSEGPAGPGANAASAEAPDVALKQIIDAAAAGDASVAWSMLPSKQQADVKAVLQETGAKMDAEVWNKGFASLGKLSQVLKTKKDFILSGEYLQKLK